MDEAVKNGEVDYLYSVKEWFSYIDTKPLIFSDSKFWFFFALVLAIAHFLRNKIVARNMFLLAFSIFFYYKSSGIYFLLLIVSTIVDYTLGGLVYKSQDVGRKKLYVTLSLISNLGLLAYYKYSIFFTDLVNNIFNTSFEARDYLAEIGNMMMGSEFNVEAIFLPVGISFYTFQTISYTLDLYKGEIEPVKNIFDFAFFVSFFPQLVAGPIVRAKDFIPQIYEKYSLSKEEYSLALYLIITGLIKKVLISDYLSVNLVDRVFDSPMNFTGIENLLAVYGYTIQIYCDFSGYSDMAIGISLLLGFRLPDNFNSPYKSLNITDFWRRWHISLSSWLRDYLYIPLGGNRGASLFTLMFVPLLYLIIIFAGDFSFLKLSFTVVLFTLWIGAMISGEKKILFPLGLVVSIIFSVFLIIAADWYLLCVNVITAIFILNLSIKPSSEKKVSTFANLFITMFLGGLWHGASLKFIIWGSLHGMALALHKIWMDVFPNSKNAGFVWKAFSLLVTFHFVVLCWIYFRAKDTLVVGQILGKISTIDFSLFFQVIHEYRSAVIVLCFGFLVHWLPSSLKDGSRDLFGKLPDPVKAICISVVILLLYQVRTSDVQPFIYFQF